ncbi:methyl-accepting chemotaxis protein [Rhodanobacter aciditrophus]|uniref:Methyl-accepting chemotaxis protein n=2 Tax=Bacteria TaxID=2 RepID=A0ABW4B071_9GAMM
MKLKSLLSVSLIAAISLPVILTTLLFAYFIKSDLTQKVTETDLPTALGEVKNAIELELSRSILPSHGISQNTFITDWIASGEPQNGLPAVQRYLTQVNRTNNGLTAFIVSGQTGHYYTQDGLVRTLGASDTWFDAFINSNAPYELSIDTDKNLDTVAVFTNYAVTVKGKRVALAGIGKSLDAMSKMIQQYQIAESGIVFLVDAKGEIKVHPDKSKVGNTFPLTGLIDQVQTVSKDGIEIVESATKLDSLDWYVVTEVPAKELFGSIQSAIMFNAGVGAVIVLFGLLGVRFLSNVIFKPVESITHAVTQLNDQDGDLTARLNIKENHEIGVLAREFDRFIAQIHDMLKQVSNTSERVRETSHHVYHNINTAHDLSDRQSHSTTSVAAAASEMEMTIKDISENAESASSAANTTDQAAREGMRFLSATIEQMQTLEAMMGDSVNNVNELSLEIQSITQVLDVIRGISEQTNLLALNAAIEAARAGEQGRGFAVVADEVRTLAQRTAESTQEIDKMIETLKSKAEQTVKTINAGSQSTQETSTRLRETGATLKDITTEVEKVSEMSHQVATATREQANATEEITRNIVIISDTSNDTMSSMKASYQLCNELDEHAASLTKAVNHFTL